MSRTARGLTGTLMRGCGRVWRRSSVRSTCCTCGEMQGPLASGDVRKETTSSVRGSRAPVAIAILVKNPNAPHDGCRIHYRDIGDYLSREQKLAALKEAGSIAELSDWQEITPDKHHDWVRQRSNVFAQFYPMGSKEARAGLADRAIFGLYSTGVNTARDGYIYNFSRDACTDNGRRNDGGIHGGNFRDRGQPRSHSG